MSKRDEEVKAFLEFHQDLLALVDKHHVTLEWLAEFVKVYSEFGWQVGTAQATGTIKDLFNALDKKVTE